MVMKKGRRVAVESSPSSRFSLGEEARARYRHQSLLQDYEELLKETEAKEKQLQKVNQKKLKLLAEVKFLQKRYKCLLKNPLQKTTYRLKKGSCKIPSSVLCHSEAPSPVTQNELHKKDRSYIAREAMVPSTSAVLDLNQVSLPNGEEMEEFQVEWETMKVDKLNKCSTDGDPAANDLKLLICRDVGNGANRAGKRKITWHDQVALKV
ncbi:uncharacterized protein LOC103711015 isoform X2 [Phoenix dactylifera]|uniref:Uncharacterized protein LOC103711015 isoform X2 n=1 Tax=Phoenix dactylifera TaxID=42345 RepID=A0A8B7CAK2_PHODC|nr:uncharacterized protein LOC103711015 isoform X2 [Phoenix dactylifera]